MFLFFNSLCAQISNLATSQALSTCHSPAWWIWKNRHSRARKNFSRYLISCLLTSASLLLALVDQVPSVIWKKWSLIILILCRYHQSSNTVIEMIIDSFDIVYYMVALTDWAFIYNVQLSNRGKKIILKLSIIFCRMKYIYM